MKVASAAIDKAWRAVGCDDFWVVLTTPTADDAAFRAAVAEADRSAAESGSQVRGLFATPCPGGFAVQVAPAVAAPAFHAWVDGLARALQGLGFDGKLAGAKPVRAPAFLTAARPPVPTVFAKFGLAAGAPVAPGPHPGWDVAPAHSARIVETAADFVTAADGEVTLMQSMFFVRVDLTDIAAPLGHALASGGVAGADVVHTPDETARRAVLGPRGGAIFQAIGSGWRSSLDPLRTLLTQLPSPLDQAFVRSAQPGVLGVHGLDAVQPLPALREHHVRYHQQLLDRWLPDAHGVQVVRRAHLDRARNLSDWVVTDLGEDRYLVEAADLEPWYAASTPDPNVLAAAREDWAGALLTPDVIAQHPND